MGMKFTDEHLMEFNAAGAWNNKKYNMLIGRDELLTAALIYGNGHGSVGSTYNFISHNVDVLNAWKAHDHE